MPADTPECWRAVCALAAREQDSEKLLALAIEINRLLEAQEQRLNQYHSDGASNATNWKPLYEAALLETDAGKLTERITIARNAIFDRIEESLSHPISSEHRAMHDALRTLRRLADCHTSRKAA